MGTTLHIGAAGELLVQYKLLKLGIDSARLTTDSGIDLVAYSPIDNRALTVQVKARERPKKSGAMSWTFRRDSPADLIALADLATDSVWILTLADANEIAQQDRDGLREFYMYADPTKQLRQGVYLHDMTRHLLEDRMPQLLAVADTTVEPD